MDLLAVLRTLRRHWVLILALTVVGALVGAASAELSRHDARSKTFYKATTTLVVDLSERSGQSQSAFQSLDQVAIFTTTGDVPDAVAEKLGTDESGRELAEHIVTTTNGSTSTVAITAAEPTANGAAELSDAFATELVRVLDEKGQEAYAEARDQLQARLDSLINQTNALIPQIAANPPNVDQLRSQLAALNNQYRITYDSYSQLAAEGLPTSRFTTLQEAEAIPIDEDEYDARVNLGATSRNNLLADANSDSSSSDDITSAPTSSPIKGPVSRGILGAFLGLLAGVGLALVVERLDRRIRTRAEAEAAFALPVLAEIPLIPKAQQRDDEIVASAAPLSRSAEAYRAIRSSLLFTRAAMGAEEAGDAMTRNGNGPVLGGTPFEPEHGEPLVVMVTSPSPGEGKTTTVANLAVVFAEAGSSVLVVNCDFRRPTIHRYFAMDDEPRAIHETRIAGVKIVTNALTDPWSNPAQAVAAQRQVVAAARGRFDVILLDTAPLLTANDAVELVASADLLVLVARIGATKTDGAERSIELLNRLDVPIAGVVLVGSTAASSDYYYYYYQPGRVPPQDAGTSAHSRAAARNVATNGNGRAASDADIFIAEGEQTATGFD